MNTTNYNVVLFKSGQDLLNSTLIIAGYSLTFTTKGKPVPEQRDDLNKWIKQNKNDKELAQITNPQSINQIQGQVEFFYTFPDDTRLNIFDFLIFCDSNEEAYGILFFNSPQKLITHSGKQVKNLELNIKVEMIPGEKDPNLYIKVISSLINTYISLPLSTNENNDWEYTTKLPDLSSKKLKKYTNNVCLYLSDLSQNIITDSSILTHFGSGYTWINDNIDLEDFNVIKAGFYLGDLVIFMYNSNNNNEIDVNHRYKLISLTQINKFGLPKSYSTGSLDKYLKDKNVKFKTFFADLVVFDNLDEGNEIYISLSEINNKDENADFTLDTQEGSRLIYNISDQWDESNKLETLTDLELISRLNKYTENLHKLDENNLYTTFNDINYRLIDKKGCWYRMDNISQGDQIWISPRGLLKITLSGNLINSQNFSYEYKWINEKLIHLLINRAGYITNYFIPITTLYNNLIISFYRESGSQSKLNVILNNGLISQENDPYSGFVEGLRRKPIKSTLLEYSSDYPLYNIVDTLRGLIFYKNVEQNKLYLL